MTRPTLVAALATLLGCSSLARVYEGAGWLPEVAAAVVAVGVAGLVGRRLRVPALMQPALAVLAAGAVVCLVYARDTLAVVLPTAATTERLGTLIGEGLLEVEQQAAPVATTPGLVLLAVLGAAAVAVVVDLLAVGLRRPALAGLPLLALLAVPSGTLEGGVGWWPFLLTAIGWLLLLVEDAGGRIARWGTTVRPGARSTWQESSLGRSGRRIGVAALGVAVVVPAMLPGLESRLLDGGGGPGFGGSRSTITYNPITELGGQLRLPDPVPLLAYSTTDGSPDYLRLTTLDRFDGSGWSSSELSADVQDDQVSEGIPVPAAVRGASSTEVTTTVEVRGLAGPWMPVPAFPTAVEVDGPWLWDDDSETVFSTRRDLEQVDDRYRVRVTKVQPDAETLRGSQSYPAEIAELAVPPQVSPYVAETTAQVVEGAETAYDKVAALQAFFRSAENGFVYSEDADVPSTGTDDALERFLRGRQGFCEQYASAMAAMVRLLGIPARVAVGFTPGREQSDGSWSVTTDDAHAWPEVWFSGAGWVRFEPTPRAEQVTTPGYTVPPVEQEPDADDPAQQPSAAPVPVPTSSGAPQGDGRQVEDPLAGEGSGADQSAVTGRRVLPALFVLALLAVPAALGVVRRRLRWREPGPRAAWAQVVEDAADVGHRVDPAHSPLTAADALVTARSLDEPAAAAAHRLANAVEQVRYARPDAVSPVPAADLRRDAAVVRAGLLAAATGRTRWTARLAPPSALRWAASVVGTGVADVLDRVDELFAAAAARVRRAG